MAEREVRYCTTEDGVRIAYSVEGEGPVLLVCADLFESFALEQMVPNRRQFQDEMAQGRTQVRFDYRGIGLSQRHDLGKLGLASMSKDLDAVVKAAKLDRFTIWSSAVGAMLAIEYAARNPGRVAALLLWGAFADIGDMYPPDVLAGFAQLCRNSWPLAAQMFGDMGSRREFAHEAMGVGALYRESTTGEVAAEMILQSRSADVTDLLAQVKSRTLVMHTINDEAVPFAQAQKLAAGIANARLVPFEGVHNEASFGDYGAVIATVNSFLDADPETRRRQPPVQPAGVTRGDMRTVLFTDLVGHTEMMSRLGDDRGRAVLREHEAITREVLKTHGGTEVKTMGDGFMASFGSVTKAVECAIAIEQAFDQRNNPVGAQHTPQPASHPSSAGLAASAAATEAPSAAPGVGSGATTRVEPLSVRVGLNAGEPIEEDGDLFGATVILASRIAAKAAGGEILVADTVRGLCIGKGFLFADRGEFAAKGFEDPVRVYEVRWRDA